MFRDLSITGIIRGYVISRRYASYMMVFYDLLFLGLVLMVFVQEFKEVLNCLKEGTLFNESLFSIAAPSRHVPNAFLESNFSFAGVRPSENRGW